MILTSEAAYTIDSTSSRIAKLTKMSDTKTCPEEEELQDKLLGLAAALRETVDLIPRTGPTI